MKWTKGPWQLDQRGGCLAVYPANEMHNCLTGANGRTGFAIHYSDKGAQFNGSFWDMDEEAKANARLIAAAPELYEALEELADLMDAVRKGEYKPDSFTGQPAELALAKARGEV